MLAAIIIRILLKLLCIPKGQLKNFTLSDHTTFKGTHCCHFTYQIPKVKRLRTSQDS